MNRSLMGLLVIVIAGCSLALDFWIVVSTVAVLGGGPPDGGEPPTQAISDTKCKKFVQETLEEAIEAYYDNRTRDLTEEQKLKKVEISQIKAVKENKNGSRVFVYFCTVNIEYTNFHVCRGPVKFVMTADVKLTPELRVRSGPDGKNIFEPGDGWYLDKGTAKLEDFEVLPQTPRGSESSVRAAANAIKGKSFDLKNSLHNITYKK